MIYDFSGMSTICLILQFLIKMPVSKRQISLNTTKQLFYNAVNYFSGHNVVRLIVFELRILPKTHIELVESY